MTNSSVSSKARRVPVPDARFDYLCEYFKPARWVQPSLWYIRTQPPNRKDTFFALSKARERVYPVGITTRVTFAYASSVLYSAPVVICNADQDPRTSFARKERSPRQQTARISRRLLNPPPLPTWLAFILFRAAFLYSAEATRAFLARRAESMDGRWLGERQTVRKKFSFCLCVSPGGRFEMYLNGYDWLDDSMSSAGFAWKELWLNTFFYANRFHSFSFAKLFNKKTFTSVFTLK